MFLKPGIGEYVLCIIIWYVRLLNVLYNALDVYVCQITTLHLIQLLVDFCFYEITRLIIYIPHLNSRFTAATNRV